MIDNSSDTLFGKIKVFRLCYTSFAFKLFRKFEARNL